MRRLVVIAFLCLLAAPAAAEARLRAFHTPSGNITCLAEGKDDSTSFLRCDTSVREWSIPPKPSSCEFDWGGSLGINRTGKPHFLCVSDATGRGGVLGYGKTLHWGAYTCTSRTTGLTCKNKKGRGWTVSRQKLVLYKA